jgi:ribosome-associated toxin RatA of RatAB toxin-antitoxin module
MYVMKRPCVTGGDVQTARIRTQGHYMEAELAVGFNMFHERYISKVTKEQDRRVEVRDATTMRACTAVLIMALW